MPQPLSRKFPNGCSYTMGLHAMSERPKMAVKFAAVISSWAAVEVELASALCEAMEASAEPFAASFQALNSTSAQASVAEAAIKTVLDVDLIDAFNVLMANFRSAKKVRDRLAHGMWGWCDRLPDDLLLIDPKKIIMRESIFVQNSELASDGETRISSCGGKHVIGCDDLMVYDGKELDQAFERNKRLAHLFTRFKWCLWKPLAKEGAALRQLLDEPEIAEGINRLQRNHRTKPEGAK